MPLARDRQRRVCVAVKQNLAQWLEALAEIESYAIPGNKARILHLMANMAQASRAIDRILEEDEAKAERDQMVCGD